MIFRKNMIIQEISLPEEKSREQVVLFFVMPFLYSSDSGL